MSPLNRQRDGTACVDLTVGNDRATTLRFLGWLKAEQVLRIVLETYVKDIDHLVQIGHLNEETKQELLPDLIGEIRPPAVRHKEECSICLSDELDDAELGPMVRICGRHAVHAQCGVRWVASCHVRRAAPTCPVCRRPVDEAVLQPWLRVERRANPMVV